MFERIAQGLSPDSGGRLLRASITGEDNMRGKIVNTVAAVMVAIAVATGGVMIAGPAQAATPTCNGHVFWFSGRWGQDLYVPVKTSSSGNVRGCELRQGAGPSGGVGSAVHALQTTLNECYGEHLTTDSEFGPATKAALIRAQRREGISADGIYGPQTADYLAFTHRNGDFVSGPCHPFYG
jgi:peptidoglycan hydrolase-like protein with peptidoglycan-binding domain